MQALKYCAVVASVIVTSLFTGAVVIMTFFPVDLGQAFGWSLGLGVMGVIAWAAQDAERDDTW